jgi:uncharacterized SAM-binding protein YcdF (DUF218 family)
MAKKPARKKQDLVRLKFDKPRLINERRSRKTKENPQQANDGR